MTMRDFTITADGVIAGLDEEIVRAVLQDMGESGQTVRRCRINCVEMEVIARPATNPNELFITLHFGNWLDTLAYCIWIK